MTTHRDVPTVIPFGEIAYAEWLDAIVNGAGRSPKWAWVAIAGDEPVGLARLRTYENERAAQNAYTGVRSDYRGRGVARALKYRTIEWCRANSIDFIYTGNDIKNVRMLAINVALGYQPLPCEIEFAKDLLG
jgi:GNAT superfamily N-acetyltransferase